MKPSREQLLEFRKKMDQLTEVLNGCAEWHENAAQTMLATLIDSVPDEVKPHLRNQAEFHAKIGMALRMVAHERKSVLELIDECDRESIDEGPTSTKLHDFLERRKRGKEAGK